MSGVRTMRALACLKDTTMVSLQETKTVQDSYKKSIHFKSSYKERQQRMNIRDLLKTMFAELRVANPSIPQHDFEQMVSEMERKVGDEPPPRIALIGATGVGKTSTLNALFNAGLEVSHTKAQTQEETAIEISTDTIHGKQGVLIVYDMPGLGESQKKRKKHLSTYERVLKNADVALWILDAHYREFESIQDYLTNEIGSINPKLISSMVFALNKVDLVYPGETAWHPYANLPSEEQENTIKARLYDVQEKVREAIPGWRGTVIGYSAAKRYNLPQLFATMLGSVPKKRQWVLASRKALADYLELVDPQFLPSDKQPNQRLKTRESSTQGRISEAVEQMTQEEFVEVSKSKDDLKTWLKHIGLIK